MISIVTHAYNKPLNFGLLPLGQAIEHSLTQIATFASLEPRPSLPRFYLAALEKNLTPRFFAKAAR